jgi:hypothetical protein
MILTYSTTRSTLAKQYWRSLTRNRRHQLLWLVQIAIAFWIGRTWAGIFFWADPGNWTLIGVGTAVAVAVSLAGYPQLRFKPQVRTLELLPTGISGTLGTRSYAFKWSDVAKIEEENGSVIITFRNLNAFIVPPEALRGLSDAQTLATECRQWQTDGSRLNSETSGG